jgi:hypothetical protein
MTPKLKTVDTTRLDLYRNLVTTIPKVDLKGDTIPYTSLNGHMFSYLHPSGAFALRLPEDEREKFLSKYKTKLFEAYGTIQKEYVTVPDTLLQSTQELKRYFDLSYRYVGTLKPMPEKKKKG